MSSFDFTPIVLASASPRRRELLQQLGVAHVVLSVDVDESPHPGESAARLATRLALAKAQAGFRIDPARPVLGSDTVVVVDGLVFGKPVDRADGIRMLSALSGRTHQVMTAVALVTAAGVAQALSRTEVTMCRVTPEAAAAYWETGEPQGKAGGYAIQGRGALFIEHISGSYSGVMGLPLYETAQLLQTLQQSGGRRMSIEILVNVAPRETRAALLENGSLQEVFIERASRRGLVSNLYKGRVSRVLPGMQAAFLEIGLARTAFLHVADILAPPPDPGNDAHDDTATDGADIRTLVREGDELLVQVVKDPLGTKGARLSTHVSLPSRYLVYMPQGSRVGVSSRIESEEERARLRDLVTTLAAEHAQNGGAKGGYIVRTAAMGAELPALHADMLYLQRLWTHVRERYMATSAGNLVHEDLPLCTRVLRDELRSEVRRVLVDSPANFARMQEFTRAFMPDFADRIELHEATRPIFDLHGVDEDISRALEARVPLKSGGYIVIQQTEAMSTVDVNTGGYVGHRNLEETIFRTNLEAAVTIARQLRVRNLGGIIVLDFIDMKDEDHRVALIAALQAALASDRAQTHIASISPLGLVEMTRKRTRESLEHMLCAACPQCQGRGFVRTPETVSHEIFRELVRQSRQFQSDELVVLAHQDVVGWLQDEEASVLAELETQVGRPIRLQSEPLYGIDQYDVVLA